MKRENPGFRIGPRRPAAAASMLLFALCVPAQALGYADRLGEPAVAALLVFLPVLSAVLMIAAVLRFGRNDLRSSVFPVCVGVLGFAYKLVMDPREEGLLHHLSAAVLYIAVVALWALTVFYVVKTKWVLAILFLLPFFKHLLVNDLPVLLGTAAPVGAATWFKELSMLSFMLACSFFAMAFEKTEAAPGKDGGGT